MAQQLPNNAGDLTPTRYTERRAPQFVGSSIDPATGNVVPVSKSEAATGTVVPPPPPPQEPTTKLVSFAAPAPRTAPDPLASVATGLAPALVSGLFKGPSSSGGGSSSGGSSGGGSSRAGDWADQPWLEPPSGSGPSLGGSSIESPGAPPPPPLELSPPPAAPAPTYSVAPPPKGSDFGGGIEIGTFICTELHRQRLLNAITLDADRALGRRIAKHHPFVYRGYAAWAPPCVRLMQRSPRFNRFATAIFEPASQHLAVLAGARRFAPLHGVAVFGLCWCLSAVIGASISLWRRALRRVEKFVARRPA